MVSRGGTHTKKHRQVANSRGRQVVRRMDRAVVDIVDIVEFCGGNVV